jgi:hypothetical protein
VEQVKTLAKKHFWNYTLVDYRGNKSKKKNNQHYVLVAQKEV